MLKSMLEKWHYARLPLRVIFDALFHACRQKKYLHKLETHYITN